MFGRRTNHSSAPSSHASTTVRRGGVNRTWHLVFVISLLLVAYRFFFMNGDPSGGGGRFSAGEDLIRSVGNEKGNSRLAHQIEAGGGYLGINEAGPHNAFDELTGEWGKRRPWNNLPIRKVGFRWRERTSFNPNGTNGDFSHFLYIDKENNELVVMEDFGVGCIYKLWFLNGDFASSNWGLDVPPSTEARLVLRLDGRVAFNLTLEELRLGVTYPFLYPLMSNQTLISGLASFLPIRYNHHWKLSFHYIRNRIPRRIQQTIQTCLDENLRCYLKTYFGIAYHRYSPDALFSWSTSETPSPSLATSAPTSYFALTRDQGETLEGRRLKSLIAQQLNHLTYISSEPYVFNPTLTLPSRDPSFSSSSSIHPGSVHSHSPPGPIPNFHSTQLVNDNLQQTVVFRTVSPGVIRRLLVQVIVPETGETALDWSQVELTMNFDGSETHQIDHISFRDFFRTGWGFVKEINATMIGVRKDSRIKEGEGWVAFCDFPMPYWSGAAVAFSFRNDPNITNSYHALKINYYLEVDETNPYKKREAGHFWARMDSDSKRVKRGTLPKGLGDSIALLKFYGWGHLVGWTWLIQAPPHYMERDPLFYWDGSRGAMFQGSGTEDYFGIGHRFEYDMNHTYSFNGVVGDTVSKYAVLTYRDQSLDPIPFNSEFKVFYQGYEDAVNFTLFRPLFFLYGREESTGMRNISTVLFGVDESSEKFKMGRQAFRRIKRSRVITGQFEGSVKLKFPFNTKLRMKPFWLGDKVWFTIPIAPEDRNHIQLILRRTYHASACENQKAQVELDGIVIGVWYCPGFNQRHHFAQDEFLLPHSLTREKTELKLVLRIQSTCWIESSVELLAVLQP